MDPKPLHLKLGQKVVLRKTFHVVSEMDHMMGPTLSNYLI